MPTFKIAIGKTGKIIEVNFDALPDNAKNFVIAYGLKQKLNDAGASITKDEEPDAGKRAEQKFSVAEIALQALLNGDISVRQSADGRTLEEREASKWLRAKYKELFKEKISEMPDSSDEFLLPKIAGKLGIAPEVLEEKLETLAIKLAEKAREIAKLKSETTIDIEL